MIAAAQAWGVPRVGVASTIGVYAGLAPDGPLHEDQPLPMTSPHVIPAFKKIGELLGDHLAGATGIEIVNFRIGAIWGPLGRAASPFFAAPQLVHAAAQGTAPDLSALPSPRVRRGRDRHVLREGPRPAHLDITRLQQDTGYRPAYDIERAVADYLSWLREWEISRPGAGSPSPRPGRGRRPAARPPRPRW